MRSRSILLALVSLSTLAGLLQATLYYYGGRAGNQLGLFWPLIFCALLALWVDADSRERHDPDRPFEFRFLVFLFVVPYLPYYLVRTRGAAGVVWAIGLAALYGLGYLLQWLVHAAR